MPHLLSESFLTKALTIPDRPQTQISSFHIYLSKHMASLLFDSSADWFGTWREADDLAASPLVCF